MLFNISTVLQWIMAHKYHVASMSHILDDFFFVPSPQYPKCAQDLQTFLDLCHQIGGPSEVAKTVFHTFVL